MNSFLEELEKNYYLFNVTNGEIIELFHFSADVTDTFRYLLAKANNKYFKNCEEMGRNIHKLGKIYLKKDSNNNCYLQVIGNDDHTVLIIRKDESNYEDYKNLIGTKITEKEFEKELDFVQRKKLEKAGISNRFLREEYLPINICKEMNVSLLISYYKYINDYNNPVVAFNEPENTVGLIQRTNNETMPRKHPIIDYDKRKKELIKRNPKKVIKFAGNKTGSRFDAYIYERDGFTLAVVEPESGTEYQYNLNLGLVDKNDDELIEEMIKSALEAKEEIVMLDDAIMRKNHTTINAFSENLDIFLDNAKAHNKFYYDVRNSNDVYKR